MKIEEVFCVDCHEWKKKEDLEGSKFSKDVLYCKDCGVSLVRTCSCDDK